MLWHQAFMSAYMAVTRRLNAGSTSRERFVGIVALDVLQARLPNTAVVVSLLLYVFYALLVPAGLGRSVRVGQPPGALPPHRQHVPQGTRAHRPPPPPPPLRLSAAPFLPFLSLVPSPCPLSLWLCVS